MHRQNQQNAYHIDGDEDDANSSGNADKLMTAITNDPDTVINFMQGLADNLYKSVHTKMQSSPLSSIYTVYNDKEMASEYSDYTDLIKKWEEKLQDKEDYYYKKFSSMETALSKLKQPDIIIKWFIWWLMYEIMSESENYKAEQI